VEVHGRGVTTTPEAAEWYRRAQRAADCRLATAALRLAVKLDPSFGIAVADLDAITEAIPSRVRGGQMNWERHHIEVVRAAAAGNFPRAGDLIREHLASVGCDPLALRIVISLRRRMGGRAGLDDLIGLHPGCHPDWRRLT
jgi:DNA-binding GntR family transcriptional regulator